MKFVIVPVCTLLMGIFSLCLSVPAAAQSEELSRLTAIQARHEDDVLKISGVVGIGIGLAQATDQLEFKVFVVEPGVERAVPTNLEGVPVTVLVTGTIDTR